jgi:tRNA threonylcarbamoyladenosine biosynthesis protein TsaE
VSESTSTFTVTTRTVGETKRVGAAVASMLVPGDIILLVGELGAGKTTLTKAIVEALGASGVTSPTFTLCHRYESAPPVAHVDCYRIDEGDDLADLALEEMLDDGCVVIVEWGERLRARFGQDALECTLTQEAGAETDQRQITFCSEDASWLSRFDALNEGVEQAVSGVSSRDVVKRRSA